MRRGWRLTGLPERLSIPLRTDANGYIGRECPRTGCGKYFKVTPGTGLTDAKACSCPYCGHREECAMFLTRAQFDHAVSVAGRRVFDAMLSRLRSTRSPHGRGPLGLSMGIVARPPHIRLYSEQHLETETTCDACALRFAIYGVFGFCPDCGAHNNLSILNANLQIITQMLALATGGDAEVGKRVIENALEDCVSAFDGWGRAVCDVFAASAVAPTEVRRVSFQNIQRAQILLKTQFGFDAAEALGTTEISALHRAFQKRHLLQHRMGVVDAEYVRNTGDMNSQIGRRVTVSVEEVERTASGVRRWAVALGSHLGSLS